MPSNVFTIESFVAVLVTTALRFFFLKAEPHLAMRRRRRRAGARAACAAVLRAGGRTAAIAPQAGPRAAGRPCWEKAARGTRAGGRPPQSPIRAAALPPRCRAGEWSGCPATLSGCCRRRTARPTAPAAAPAAAKAVLPAGLPVAVGRSRRFLEEEVGWGEARHCRLCPGLYPLFLSCCPLCLGQALKEQLQAVLVLRRGEQCLFVLATSFFFSFIPSEQ